MNLSRDKASRLPDHSRAAVSARHAVGAGVLALAAAAALAGCGEIKNTVTPASTTTNQLTIELAGPPSAYYVGMYAAQALGYFKQTDINVTFQTPATGQVPLTMLHDGQVVAAVSSEPSVFLARNQEMPLVAVGALVHSPLSQIPITLPPAKAGNGGKGVTSTTTGTTTTATATATTKTTTKNKTTTVATTTTTTPGATTIVATTPATTTTTPTPSQVPTGSVWPAQLQALLAQSSAPTYNALVIVVRKGTIVDHAPLVRRFVQAVARGYESVRTDPKAGVADLIAADPGLAKQQKVLLATVRSLLPSFFPPNKPWGWQSEKDWNSFGTWLYNNKLITNPNAVVDASTNELLAGQGV